MQEDDRDGEYSGWREPCGSYGNETNDCLGLGNDNRDNNFLHILAKYKLESWAEMAVVLQNQKAIDADTLYDGP